MVRWETRIVAVNIVTNRSSSSPLLSLFFCSFLYRHRFLGICENKSYRLTDVTYLRFHCRICRTHRWLQIDQKRGKKGRKKNKNRVSVVLLIRVECQCVSWTIFVSRPVIIKLLRDRFISFIMDSKYNFLIVYPRTVSYL